MEEKKKIMSKPAEPQKALEPDFDLSPLQDLYTIVELLKDKKGNDGDWVQTCRWGLRGMEARFFGIQYNYSALKNLKPDDFIPLESCLSSIFFHMDSVIECMVFALNALGNPLNPQNFYRVDNATELRRINPNNVIVTNKAFEGYSKVFPNFQKLYFDKQGFINKVVDYHDVSKHRHMLKISTMSKSTENPNEASQKKLEFVQVNPNPRAPHCEGEIVQGEYVPVYLDELLGEFKLFIKKSFKTLLEDIQNIRTRLEE